MQRYIGGYANAAHNMGSSQPIRNSSLLGGVALVPDFSLAKAYPLRCIKETNLLTPGVNVVMIGEWKSKLVTKDKPLRIFSLLGYVVSGYLLGRMTMTNGH